MKNRMLAIVRTKLEREAGSLPGNCEGFNQYLQMFQHAYYPKFRKSHMNLAHYLVNVMDNLGTAITIRLWSVWHYFTKMTAPLPLHYAIYLFIKRKNLGSDVCASEPGR
jgi:hypothetical protein